MDALADVIQLCRLQGQVFSRAWLDAPWGVSAPDLPHGIFHALVEGECWVVPEGHQATKLTKGDVVFLPHGTPHIMCDRPGRDAPPIASLSTPGEAGGVGSLRIEGLGERTELICGTIMFSQGEGHPLLEVLPKVLIIHQWDTNSRTLRTLEWLHEELVSQSPGADVMISRLTEVLLVQAIRDWLGQDQERPGWLGGLTDTHIAKAMGHIHRQPDQQWTVASLAKVAGMSRSGFASRFQALVGESPHKYLTRWRMHLAARALDQEKVSLAEIAQRIGYSTEFAFSKAFKNTMGMSPSAYKKAKKRAVSDTTHRARGSGGVVNQRLGSSV